jgi:hypothetical protein
MESFDDYVLSLADLIALGLSYRSTVRLLAKSPKMEALTRVSRTKNKCKGKVLIVDYMLQSQFANCIRKPYALINCMVTLTQHFKRFYSRESKKNRQASVLIDPYKKYHAFKNLMIREIRVRLRANCYSLLLSL